MVCTSHRRSRLGLGVGALLLAATVAPSAARADFFDGMRQTFQSDIPHFFQNDVPHFFQDDIPCAFGGRPTSGTKKSCSSSDRPATSPADKDQRAAPLDKNTKDSVQPATSVSRKNEGHSPSSEKAMNDPVQKPTSENERGTLPSSVNTTGGSDDTKKGLGETDVGANGHSANPQR